MEDVFINHACIKDGGRVYAIVPVFNRMREARRRSGV